MTPSHSVNTDSLDKRTFDWYVDFVVRILVFAGGMSAILLILGIFVFITTQGLGFVFGRFDWFAQSCATPNRMITGSLQS